MNNKVLKSSVWYFIANAITVGIGFFSSPVFNRIMSVKEVGDYANFTTWVAIIQVIVTLSFYTSVTLAKFDFKNDFYNFIGNVLLLGTISTLFFYLITLLYYFISDNRINARISEINIIFIYCAFSPALLVFQSKSRLEYKYKSSVLISLISSTASIITALICVINFSDKYIARVLGTYLPLIIVNLAVYIYLFRGLRNINVAYWKYAASISLPMIFHLLGGQILSSSDRIMLKQMRGSDEVAYYSVAYTTATVISILWTSMNTAWSPWAFEQIDKKNYDGMRRFSKPYILFFLSISSVFLLFAPDMLWIMGGSRYTQAVYVIPPVVVAFAMQFIYSLFVNIEIYYKKQGFIATGTGIAATVNLILNYVFIPQFGYIAAAYTTLVGYAALFCIHYVFVKKIGKVYFYDINFIKKVMVLYLILTGAIIFSYRMPIVRWTLLIILLVIIVVICISLKNEIKIALLKKNVAPLLEKLYNSKFKYFIN